MKSLLVSIIAVAILSLGSATVVLAETHVHGEIRCPFMVDPGAFCLMAPAEHLSALKARMVGVLYQLSILFLLGALAVYITKVHGLRIAFRWRQPIAFSVRAHQELYSQGILNPKAP